MRGAVLLALTLGIYRFWFATDIRRFLWSNTEIAGDSLEYTGTALELLIGFLIAIALLVPLYVMLFIVALSLGAIGELVGLLAFPLLAFLGHFAVYRARRYRLTRTIYRGVRCHQDGSAARYAVVRAVLVDADHSHARACLSVRAGKPGALQDAAHPLRQPHRPFRRSGFRLFLRGLPMWLLVIGPLAFALALRLRTVEWDKVLAAAAAAPAASQSFINQLEGGFPAVYAAVVRRSPPSAVSVVMAAVLFPVFQAMMLRWWLSGLRLDGLTVTLASAHRPNLRRLSALPVVRRCCSRWPRLSSEPSHSWHFSALVEQLGRAELGELLGAAAARRLLCRNHARFLGHLSGHRAARAVALRCRIGRARRVLPTLDHVKAGGAPSSAVGEGLADALNVGGF